MLVFNQSVRGSSHVQNKTRMEDFSASYQTEQKECSMIAVADGHGDSRCFRSHLGSQFAVEIAIDQFKAFFEALRLHPDMSVQNIKNNLYNVFSNNIFKGWKKKCLDHYKENPFTNEEISLCPEVAEYDILHVYGSTLIAAMLYQNHLIILQQGDGHVVMAYEDGHFDMPVALDARCVGNVTTSLCDIDAEEKFTLSLFDTKQNKISACFIGTDGVEDSFANDQLTMSFYMKLAKEFVNHRLDLAQDFSKLSELGSHDDISVACIYDLSSLKDNVEKFDTFIQKTENNELLHSCLAELRSKERKKTYYEKKMAEWQENLRLEKEAFESSILKQLEVKRHDLAYVNDQLKVQKQLKIHKRSKKKNRVEEIQELLNRLDKENRKNVQFFGTDVLSSKDCRAFLFKKIRKISEGLFEFPFDMYEELFSEYMNFDVDTMMEVENFMMELSSCLDSVPKEEPVLYDAHAYKMLNSEKKCLQQECAHLENELNTFVPEASYIKFKNEYIQFMEAYRRLENKCKELKDIV